MNTSPRPSGPGTVRDMIAAHNARLRRRQEDANLAAVGILAACFLALALVAVAVAIARTQ